MIRFLSSLVVLLSIAVCCGKNQYQMIKMRNRSLEPVYFLISSNVVPKVYEIARIRPITSSQIDEIKIEHADKEQTESIKHNLYRYLIEKDSMETLLTSESAGIFVNAISLQDIIRDRYNGKINVFIITESDLKNYSDKEIIDKKLYTRFKALKAEDVKEDMLILEYP